MKVTFKINEFDHLKDRSGYNHNYYKHKEHKFILLQICDELANDLDWYVVEDVWKGEIKIFIGSTECKDEDDPDCKYEFEFGYHWT